jgi:hypothetical protein
MFSKICFALCLTFASALALGPSRAHAQNFVSAKVLASEGQVEIQREASGKSRVQNIAFKVDDELRAGDAIVTGKNGKLVLGLSDGSQAVIAPKTTVIIQDLSQSPRTLFQMIKGKTRIHIEKLGGQPNPYRVNTPTAVIAVRGTIFDVLVEEDKTQVFLHEGEVAVINQTLPNQPVLLTAGQMTQVLLQRQPNAPSLFKTGRNDGVFKMNRGGVPNDGRIAERNRQPGDQSGNGRGDSTADNNRRPDLGRGNPQDNRGARPDNGRGTPPPNNAPNNAPNNMPNNGPRPSAEPRGSGGKRPDGVR